MGKVINELDEIIKEIEEFSLPTFSELPEIQLYMEQVISYVKESVGVLEQNKDIAITPFMINNYVKARIIEGPKEKKYNRNHVGYLIAISLLKSVVSMKDLASLIDIDRLNISGDVYKEGFLYDTFKEMQEDALKNVVHKVKARLEVFRKANNKKSSKKGMSAEEADRRSLAYAALKLYIESEANKIMADAIMDKISSLPTDDIDLSKYDRKKTAIEAKKLSERKKNEKGDAKK